MLIWLITTGEILPGNIDRPHRTGMLSEALIKNGHEVLWWTTTFDHQTKKYIHQKSFKEKISKGFDLFFLHSDFNYKKNISIRRLINHAGVAHSFAKYSLNEKKPDLIFCSFPTIELSYQAVNYGLKNNVPVILDVRDLWPDIFIDPFPKWVHPLARLGLFNYYSKTSFALKNCRAITAVSNQYLEWALVKANRIRNFADTVFPLGYKRLPDLYAEKTLRNNFLTEKGIDIKKTIVWFVGTFGQTYDLSTVINAAKILDKQNNSDIQFVFTGDGQRMQEWTKKANELSNIVFTGWLNKEHLAYISEIANIGLMAYRENAPQSLPNKTYEYMSAGIPILSSLQGETKELIETHEIGFTYTASNVESFLNQLDKMTLDKKIPEQMSAKAKTLFNSEFSSEIVYQKLVNYIIKQIN